MYLFIEAYVTVTKKKKINITFVFQGVNGSVNGNSTTSVSGINTSVLSTTTASSAGQAKVIISVGGSRKCNQEQNKNQGLDARAVKIKDKVKTMKKKQGKF